MVGGWVRSIDTSFGVRIALAEGVASLRAINWTFENAERTTFSMFVLKSGPNEMRARSTGEMNASHFALSISSGIRRATSSLIFSCCGAKVTGEAGKRQTCTQPIKNVVDANRMAARARAANLPIGSFII